MEGFEDFLRPPRFKELSRTGVDGPVVILNLSKHRCDALVVNPGSVQVIPLSLDVNETLKRQEAYLRAITELERRSGDAHAGTQQAGQVVLSVLEWLWDDLAEPVLDALGHDTPLSGPNDSWPRVWWCPTGLLANLPIHAAGYHDPDDANLGNAPATVLDRVVSSYTTSLRALTRARHENPANSLPPRCLLLSYPEPPPYSQGLATLLYAESEAKHVREGLPHAVTEVGSNAATRTKVLKLLPEHPFVHLICHANIDSFHPADSALYLHDEPLKVTDIAQLVLDGAELAYLSACFTAAGGYTLADEASHLAAAFQFAGFRHVIAATHAVKDHPASRIAKEVYRALADRGTPVDVSNIARDLHGVVRRARDDFPYEPLFWVPFTHFGH